MSAGTDTGAHLLQYSTWNFLTKSAAVRARILSELSTVVRDENGRLPMNQLEALPYLNGFIRETLRMNTSAPTRLPRVVPREGLMCLESRVFLPAGTVVAFSIDMLHKDPRCFEDPLEFRPERWMGECGKELDTWLLSFGKGDSQCVGIK